jgi:predicted AAA+ superfamily ATPase
MEGFSVHELGIHFDVERALRWGCLPFLWAQNNAHGMPPEEFLSAYLNTYIKEEIREEGLIRRLDPFLRILEVAGHLNGQTLNSRNISREDSIPRTNIDNYFSILEDTMMGQLIPAYSPGAQVREVAHPRFYWFDPGVARAVARLHRQELDRITLGVQFETLVLHELRVFMEVNRKEWPIRYYAVPSGGDVDFVVETKKT